MRTKQDFGVRTAISQQNSYVIAAVKGLNFFQSEKLYKKYFTQLVTFH